MLKDYSGSRSLPEDLKNCNPGRINTSKSKMGSFGPSLYSLRDAVVTLVVVDSDKSQYLSNGFITPDGYIVTVHIKCDSKIYGQIYNFNGCGVAKIFELSLLASDIDYNISMLKIKGFELTGYEFSIQMNRSDNLGLGETVYLIGKDKKTTRNTIITTTVADNHYEGTHFNGSGITLSTNMSNFTEGYGQPIVNSSGQCVGILIGDNLVLRSLFFRKFCYRVSMIVEKNPKIIVDGIAKSSIGLTIKPYDITEIIGSSNASDNLVNNLTDNLGGYIVKSSKVDCISVGDKIIKINNDRVGIGKNEKSPYSILWILPIDSIIEITYTKSSEGHQNVKTIKVNTAEEIDFRRLAGDGTIYI